MIIQNIKIQNLRSYEFAELPLNKGINAIYGKNGSGKTSLLEAIYFGLSLKSFRTSKTEQIIRNNELKGEVLITGSKKTIRTTKNKTSSKAIDENNEKKIARKELLMLFPTCVVENKEFSFTDAQPDYKRKYLNKILFYVEQDFNDLHKKLIKIHKQRLFCLKNGQKDEILIWNKALIEIEPQITTLNKILINDLNNFFTSNSNLSDFFGKNDWLKGINFKYNSGFDENIGLEKHIQNNFEKEFMINKPLVGLHKRNFDILLDQDDASSILSRGQQKVLSCILHLVSKEFIEKSLKIQPVVLIDDICSELDKENQHLMLKYLHNMNTQAILTSIEKIAFDHKFNVNLFYVEQKGDISNVKR
ncbi:MAG: DNA replication/repair protein RecF [Gammaproteobacteria bacterium]